MFLKWITRVALFVCCIDLYGASIVDVPLKNEQQRQIYEQNQNVDTNIPKSDLRKPIDIPP